MIVKGFILIIFFSLCSYNISFSQEKPIIYLFPGQGSDERLFDSINFENNYKIVHIKYPIPEKGCSLAEYAKRFLSKSTLLNISF